MLVDVEDKMYDQISALVKKNKIDFPTIQFFVNQAVKKELKRVKK